MTTTKLLCSLVVLTLTTSAEAEKLATKDEGPAGLAKGDTAPQFNLPVVNSYKETAKKWGPAKFNKDDTQKKLVLMSFFATFCEPCKKEMPELVRLHKAYEEQGLGVMLVSIDRGKEKRDEVVALAEENKVEFPLVHDRFQVVAKRYKATRLPYMVMLGPDGVVKAVHVGYTEELKASLENEVRGHLGLKPLKKKKTRKKRRRRRKGK